MNIGICGYGKMGKSIEKIAVKRGHNIIFTSNNINTIKLNKLKIDVVVEFSNPKSAFNNITHCLNNHIPIVSGTTGWLDRLPDAKKLCTQTKGTFVHATNFSIGMHTMFMINNISSKLINNDIYNLCIEETHHTEKKDIPSGTAITLAKSTCSNIDKFKSWQSMKEGLKIPSSKIPIWSYRKKNNIGEHHIKYKSDNDEITISHKSLNRDGFSTGAVIAAEFIQFKTGFFTMSEIIKNL